MRVVIKDFLALVQDPPALGRYSKLSESLRGLVDLFSNEGNRTSEGDYIEAPYLEYSTLRRDIAPGWTELGFYPAGNRNELLTGDALDDLVDITSDLMKVAWRFENTSEDDARSMALISFETHWKEHATDLLLHLERSGLGAVLGAPRHLVPIVGPALAGKTSLAQELATALPDGVFRPLSFAFGPLLLTDERMKNDNFILYDLMALHEAHVVVIVLDPQPTMSSQNYRAINDLRRCMNHFVEQPNKIEPVIVWNKADLGHAIPNQMVEPWPEASELSVSVKTNEGISELATTLSIILERLAV